MTLTRDPETSGMVAPARPRWGLAILVIGALLVAAGFAFWPRTAPDVAAPPAAVTPGQAAPAGCARWPANLPANAADANTTWTTIGAVPAPSAPGVGPAFTTPVRACYARTAAGAVFAAMNFQAVINGPGVRYDVAAAALIADTPARQMFTDLAAGAGPGGPGAAPPAGQLLQWVGYHVITATKDTAVVDIAMTWKGQLTATVFPLRWEGNTWRFVLPDDLSRSGWAARSRDLTTLIPDYWTRWSSGGGE